jgi:flavodoxin
MDVAVRYYSRSGNTQKVAEAMGEALGSPAKTVEEPVSGTADLLFLGGALYAGDIDKRLQAFIESLKPEQVKKAVVFGTAAGDKGVYAKIKGLLDRRGIPAAAEFFHCRGKFLIANRGRPNEQDLKNAGDFARGFVSHAPKA